MAKATSGTAKQLPPAPEKDTVYIGVFRSGTKGVHSTQPFETEEEAEKHLSGITRDRKNAYVVAVQVPVHAA